MVEGQLAAAPEQHSSITLQPKLPLAQLQCSMYYSSKRGLPATLEDLGLVAQCLVVRAVVAGACAILWLVAPAAGRVSRLSRRGQAWWLGLPVARLATTAVCDGGGPLLKGQGCCPAAHTCASCSGQLDHS